MNRYFVSIIGFEEYSICRTGKIYSKKSKRILKIQRNKDGNEYVLLRKNGKSFTKSVKKLIHENFDKKEEFKDINGFENYKINSNGDVWSLSRNLIISQQTDENGYKYVFLYKDGKMYSRYINKLIKEIWKEEVTNFF